jgi:uncharacterized protein YjlB
VPVVRTAENVLDAGTRPSWCNVTAAGTFALGTNSRFDRHYHDCNEYWLVFRGRARILSEGVEYDVGPGDIVCTKAGDEHDVLGVFEDFAAFFFEDALLRGGRAGHLHRTPELARGHVVPVLDPA